MTVQRRIDCKNQHGNVLMRKWDVQQKQGIVARIFQRDALLVVGPHLGKHVTVLVSDLFSSQIAGHADSHKGHENARDNPDTRHADTEKGHRNARDSPDAGHVVIEKGGENARHNPDPLRKYCCRRPKMHSLCTTPVS